MFTTNIWVLNTSNNTYTLVYITLIVKSSRQPAKITIFSWSAKLCIWFLQKIQISCLLQKLNRLGFHCSLASQYTLLIIKLLCSKLCNNHAFTDNILSWTHIDFENKKFHACYCHCIHFTFCNCESMVHVDYKNCIFHHTILKVCHRIDLSFPTESGIVEQWVIFSLEN